MRESGFALLNDVVLNQVVVSFGDPATTEEDIDVSIAAIRACAARSGRGDHEVFSG